MTSVVLPPLDVLNALDTNGPGDSLRCSPLTVHLRTCIRRVT
jgi:hypothetical protein